MSEDALEPLITQCPTCRTRFRVTEAQLNVAAGRVRCGACLSVFAGIDHLVLGAGPRLRPGESPNEALDALLDELRADEPTPRVEPAEQKRAREPVRVPSNERLESARPRAKPLGQAETTAKQAAASEISARSSDVDSDEANVGTKANTELSVERDEARAQVATEGGEPQRDASSGVEDRTAAAEAPDAAPAEAAAEPAAPANVALALGPEDLIERPRRRRRWWLPLLVLLGIGLLAAQVLYFQFDAWAKNPDIRPVYEWLCPRLHCQLPVMRSLDDIRSKNLIVRANPEVPGQLMVDALIVNQARFAQPFPVIELRFSSMDGRPIAARRFAPDEYLAGELKGATMFAPLTPVHIAFAIDDPGTDAVSYYIQFR